MSKDIVCPKCDSKLVMSWYQPNHWTRYYFCPECRDYIYDWRGNKISFSPKRINLMLKNEKEKYWTKTIKINKPPQFGVIKAWFGRKIHIIFPICFFIVYGVIYKDLAYYVGGLYALLALLGYYMLKPKEKNK